MSKIEYGESYPHFVYCMERSKRPSRRIFDVFRHTIPLIGSVKSGDQIIDIGSGIGETGHDLKWLGVRTTSVDVSFYAQQLGSKRFGQESKNQRVVANSLELPFPKNSYDFATSWDLVEHLNPEQIAQMLSELKRVTKGDRMFIKLTPTEDKVNINVDNTHITKWNQDRWSRFFLENGLITVSNPTRQTLGRVSYGNFLLERVN